MKRIVWFVVPALILALAAPVVLAGDSGKCTLSTQDCLDMMAKKLKSKGWLGVEINDEAGQMKIVKILSGSPAEKAGLAAGDVLFAMNGVEYTEANAEKLSVLREEMTPGKIFTFTVRKAGKDTVEVPVTLSLIPQDIMAQVIGKHMLEHASASEAEK
jgi:predicted metalloprotease with PDZ domain